MKQRLDKGKLVFLAVLLLSFGFYLWYACQLPYTHDDWDWGINSGMQHLLNADVNSRYAGNLFEVLVTRSVLLKDLAISLIMTGIPLCAVSFALRFSGTELSEPLTAPVLLIAATILQLATIPLIWQETYGWIAGFSNFTVSALMLSAYHILLAKGLCSPSRASVRSVPALFLFGLALQLFLENVTVYVVFVTLVYLAVKAVRRRRITGNDLALLAGIVPGTVLMFSSSIYGTLLNTGYAVGGYRQLTFELDQSLPAIAFSLAKRFLLLFPPSLWAASPVPIAAALLLTAGLMLRRRLRGAPVFAAVNAALALYVIYLYFFGDFGRLKLESSWWSNALSALIGLGIGALVPLEFILLWRREPKPLLFALFCWFSRPAVMLPMVVIHNADPRSFLTTDVLLAPVVLLLLARLWPEKAGLRRRLACGVVLAMLCAALVHIAVPFAAIGRVSRQRDAMIREAREHPGEPLLLPDFPAAYRELLWDPDPVSPRSEYVGYFRIFYGIPDETPLWFESWGDGAEKP